QLEFANYEEYQQLLKSKTLVVEYDYIFSSFNDVMKEAMPKFWNLTPYEFITNEEFKSKRNNPAYSFIFISEAEIQNQNYDILNFVLGNKQAKDINSLHDLGSVPLSYSDADEDNYIYKIGTFLLYMQYLANYKINNPKVNLLKEIMNRNEGLKDYELMITEDDLSPQLKGNKEVLSGYPFKIFIKTSAEIGKLINEKVSNVAILHKIAPEENFNKSLSWKFIISAIDGNLLYFSMDKINSQKETGLNKEDLKKLSK
nr:hypothetical protein [Bacteroidales bacterium]